MKTHAFWTKDVDPALQAKLMLCFDKSFKQKSADGYFDWKYKENPAGDSLHVFTETEGEVVASRVFWRMDLPNQRGYQCVDTAVLESFRGRGLFSRSIDIAKEVLNGDLIYNLPNSQSGPLYLKKGWAIIDNSESIRLVNRFSLKNSPEIHWNEDMLEWRFTRHPVSNYFQCRVDDDAYIFARRRGMFYVLMGKTSHCVNLQCRRPHFFFSYDRSVRGVRIRKCLPLMYHAGGSPPLINRYLLDMA